VFPVFLVVVFSFLSAYLYMCVCSIWAMLPELNKMNNGDHNFINITNKEPVSRSCWRTCRACCCSMRDTARTTFPIQKCMG